MNGKSKKVIETEKFVDKYIKKHGYPPTYKEIEKQFNLSKCAAYHRCDKFRHKMSRRKTQMTERSPDIIVMNIEYEIPKAKFEAFCALLSEIKSLLTA